MTDFDQLVRDPVSRRAFLTRMAAAGLGAAATAMLAGCGGGGNGTSNNSSNGNGTTVFADSANFPGIPGRNENVVVLNFALTLETLEADLYRQALNLAAGFSDYKTRSLPSDTSSYTLRVSSGGLSTAQAQAGFLYLQQYASVEAAHRDFLHDVAIPSLGGTPVEPNARGYNFQPAGSDLKSILTIIRTAEETGVRAYLGAAPFLTSADLVQTASTIYSTEAAHSAAINYALGVEVDPTPMSGDKTVTGTAYPGTHTFEYYQTPPQVLAAVRPFFA